MLDEGTGYLSAIDVSEAFARIGAEYDVDVGPDVTSFTVTTLVRFAEPGALLLADLLLRPSLRESEFGHLFGKEGFIDALPEGAKRGHQLDEMQIDEDRPLLENDANEGDGLLAALVGSGQQMLEAAAVRMLNAA